MSMISVRSSAIAAIGYEGGVLAVLFHNSGLYLHPGVPAWIFLGLMAASSKGSFYNHHIRGKYK